MQTISAAALTASLLAAALAQGQSVQPSVFAQVGQPAPGVSGPYTLGGAPWIGVGEGGEVVMVNTMLRDSAASRVGIFTAGNGRPLTNIADENADVSIAEFGPDDITALYFGPAAPVSNDNARIRSDGTVAFYAELATDAPAPGGGTSRVVTLEGDGTAEPVVTSRRGNVPIAFGQPLAIWHELETSPDDTNQYAFYQSGTDSSIWAVSAGAIGVRLVQDGDGVFGSQLPTDWLAWRIGQPERPVIGDTGRVAFVARCETSTNGLVAEEAVFVAVPQSSRAPLYDPRFPEAAFAGIPAGASVVSLSVLGVTAADTVVVRARVPGTGSGLWSFDPSGVGTPLLIAEDPAPEFAPDTEVAAISNRRAAGGRVSVSVQVKKPAEPDDYAVYTIENDGGFGLRARSGDPVEIPGRAGGPFELEQVFSAPFFTAEGQMLFEGSFADASGAAHSALLFTDADGVLRTMAIVGDQFDFEPASAGGEATITALGIRDMNASGRAAITVTAVLVGRSAFATASIAAPVCPADTNGDGILSPADFNAWILAFNNAAPACDQNGDGACSPADFNAWILNYNAGCG